MNDVSPAAVATAADRTESGAAPLHGIPFSDAVRVWARIAALSFGGPAGQIAVMHRILVEEKRWIGENRFLHAAARARGAAARRVHRLAAASDMGRLGRGHALRSARPPRYHGLELDLR